MGSISTIFIRRWITTLGNTSTAESKVLSASLRWIFMVQMEPFFLASHWRNRAVSMIGGESDYWQSVGSPSKTDSTCTRLIDRKCIHCPLKILAGPDTLHLRWLFNYRGYGWSHCPTCCNRMWLKRSLNKVQETVAQSLFTPLYKFKYENLPHLRRWYNIKVIAGHRTKCLSSYYGDYNIKVYYLGGM
jgi:hypothetical protein